MKRLFKHFCFIAVIIVLIITAFMRTAWSVSHSFKIAVNIIESPVVTPDNPPLAKFDAEPVSGVKPLDVDFTDLSTGNITDWLWDFGDGSTSTAKNPTHTYTQSGVYTVNLTVTGFDGITNTEIKIDYINISEPNESPVVKFTADPTSSVKVPLNVSFTDESEGDINSWAWNFGDGNTSTAKSPIHDYTEANIYTVSLRVTGPGGSDTLTKNEYIVIIPDDDPPIAMLENTPAKISNQIDYTLTVTGFDIVSYKYELDYNGEIGPVDINEPIVIKELIEGDHTLILRGMDDAGNWQTEEQATIIEWTVDLTPPGEVELINYPVGTIGFTSINIVVSGIDVQYYKYQIDENDWSSIKLVSENIIETLEDGFHTLQVITSDAVGNWQSELDVIIIEWTVDTTLPAAILYNLPDVITNEIFNIIDVGGDDIESYKFRIQGTSEKYDGTWSEELSINEAIAFSVTEGGEEDGVYTLEVVGKNSLEIWQEEENATYYEWTIDTIAPNDFELNAELGIPSTSLLNLSWSPPEDDLKKYEIRYSESELIDEDDWDNAVQVFNFIVPGKTSDKEKFSISKLRSGITYYFAIKSIDSACNISDMSTVSIDTDDNLSEISSFYLTNSDSEELTTGDNSEARELKITGKNFISGKGSLVRFENVFNVFDVTSKAGSNNELYVDVPEGAAVGTYNLRIINSNGISTISSDTYVVTEAPELVPEVTKIFPPAVNQGSETTISIIGNNFIDGSDSVSTVILVSETDTELPLSVFNIKSINEIEAVVPESVEKGIYQIKLKLVDRSNAISAKFGIYQAVDLSKSSGTTNTTSGVQLPDDGTFPVTVSLSTDMQIDAEAVSTNNAEIEVSINPGTVIQQVDEFGNSVAYTGVINPPRQIQPDAEDMEKLGDNVVVFTMGSTDEKLLLGENQTILVKTDISVPDYESAPLIYYLEADGSFTLAGLDKEKDGVYYEKGGTILSVRNQTPEEGYITYTFGLLLDHMSNFAVGQLIPEEEEPSIEPAIEQPDDETEEDNEIYDKLTYSDGDSGCFVDSVFNIVSLIALLLCLISAVIGYILYSKIWHKPSLIFPLKKEENSNCRNYKFILHIYKKSKDKNLKIELQKI
ncbi:hypothetical protein GMMP15_1050014 [Candidatus Magnetomoraceae bacterium gMMP-15]